MMLWAEESPGRGVPGSTRMISDRGRDVALQQRALTDSRVGRALRSTGRPLEGPISGVMESRFGFDFARVRVHTDPQAASAAAAIGARAFTVGQNVYFGERQYAPQTPEGRRLLGHELAHTVQQRDARDVQPAIRPGSPEEATAERAGRDAAADRRVTGTLGVSPLAIARAPDRASYLDADERILEEEESGARWRLRREPEGPDRDYDLKTISEIATELERRNAIRESEKTIATIGSESAEQEEVQPPTPMALSSSSRVRSQPTRSPAAGAPSGRAPSASAARPGQSPLSKFAPGGWTDKDTYGDWEESEKRIATESQQFHDKSRPSFSERFYKARREGAANDEFTDGEIWDRGLNQGLFVWDDRWEFEQMWEEKIGKPARQSARHNADVESVRREMAWEAKGDEATHSVETGIFQGIAFGALGAVPGTAYEAYTDVETAKQTVDAVRSGNVEDIVGAGIQVAGAYAAHEATGGARDITSEPGAGRARLPSEPGRVTSPVAVKGGGKGTGEPTGLLRDVDAPSGGVNVKATHPLLKTGKPANTNEPPRPPQAAAAKVAVNAPHDVPRATNLERGKPPVPPKPKAEPARMAKPPRKSGDDQGEAKKSSADELRGAEHTSGARPSTRAKHEAGQATKRKQQSQANEREKAAELAGQETVRKRALEEIRAAVRNLPDKSRAFYANQQKPFQARLSALIKELSEQNSPLFVEKVAQDSGLTMTDVTEYLARHNLLPP